MPKNEEFFNGFADDILNPDEFENEDDLEEDEEETEEDDNSDVETETETNEDSSQTEEDSKENVKTQEELDAEKKAQEQHERNEREKAKRLAREQKEREERERQIKEQAKLEAELGVFKENTFTNQDIVDEHDLKIFKIQQQIKKENGDPFYDLPKKIAEINRKEQAEIKAKEEEIKDKEEERKKQQSLQSEEIVGFHKRNPNIKLEDLVKKGFDEKVDLYNEEMTYAERVYAFLNEISTQEDSDDKEEDESNSKRKVKTPSSISSGSKGSKKSYLEMSDKEFIEMEKAESLDFF